MGAAADSATALSAWVILGGVVLIYTLQKIEQPSKLAMLECSVGDPHPVRGRIVRMCGWCGTRLCLGYGVGLRVGHGVG